MATPSNVAPSARRVFISYARKDGVGAAHQLRDALRGAGCEVWLDSDQIRGGASWSKEIEAAISGCDVLMAVLTREADASEICRAEHIWALDEGKMVIPVLAVADAPVPIYLKSRNWRKYPEQQRELLADITAEPAAAPPTPRALHYDTVPNLPRNHVIREKALADLRDLVFTESAGGNIAVTALAGMGGIGKTVLATALCRDIAVQRAFPDGIAWITIGREWGADFETRMREVARALGDDLSGYDTALACENRYRTLLRDKAALVVVDDVWSLEHLKPLLVDAPRSRFLFTTRDTGIVKAVTDRKYAAKLLNDSEARDLLAHWAGVPVANLPAEAGQIIQACGDLAGAVAQIGASLRDLSPAEWRDTLEALEGADVSAIEDRLPSGQQSFFKSLAVSFQAVRPEMQERYLKLAVLLEDVPLPAVVLQTLWRVNEAEGRRTARYFVDRSLASWEDEGDPVRGIRLHDLQLDYVRARFRDQPALRLIHGALRLSANVIAKRPEEFASQMSGRLLLYEGIEAVAEFANGVGASELRPWLRPLWPTLHPPGAGLTRTLEGHSNFVVGVAITPDGKRAVSASWDKTLKVWDLETGRALHTLEGHASLVAAVAITPDGKLVVSGSWDKTLKVWDLETGRELRTLAGNAGHVNGIAVMFGGKAVVSAYEDCTLKVWDLETGNELRTLAGHSDEVNGVAVMPDGKQAVSVSKDKTLKVWDLESGRTIRTVGLRSHSLLFGKARAVAVTPDGSCAVSADDETLNVWDLDTGRILKTLVGHSSPVSAVAVTPDGRRAVSASDDKTLKLWDLETGQVLNTLEGHSASVAGVALTPRGKRAVSASWDKTLKVWDVESGHTIHSMEAHTDSVLALVVTADGKRAVSRSQDHTIKVWDLGAGRALHTLKAHRHELFLDSWGSFAGLAMMPDGSVVSATNDKTLALWDLETGETIRTLLGQADSPLARVDAFVVASDGKRAVSFGDKTLKVWDLETGRAQHTLNGHYECITDVALTPDGKRAVSASLDKTLKVWDLETGRDLCTFEGHIGGVLGVAIGPDGRFAVSASSDKVLKLWDLASAEELRTLGGSTASIIRVAMSTDGCLVAAVLEGGMLSVWDLTRGGSPARFTCESEASCCAFAGSRHIVAGDSGGRLYLLRLERLPAR